MDKNKTAFTSNTCLSMDCPFAIYCNNYNSWENRGKECETQKFIVEGAKRIIAKKNKERKEN